LRAPSGPGLHLQLYVREASQARKEHRGRGGRRADGGMAAAERLRDKLL